MPKVPDRSNVIPIRPGPMPSMTDMAMAAAMMQAEGRFAPKPQTKPEESKPE